MTIIETKNWRFRWSYGGWKWGISVYPHTKDSYDVPWTAYYFGSFVLEVVEQ